MRICRRASLIVLFSLPIAIAQTPSAKTNVGIKPPAKGIKAGAEAATPTTGTPAPASGTDAPKPWNLSSEPSVLKAGQSYTLPVRLPAAECGAQNPTGSFSSLDKVVAATPASIDVKGDAFSRMGDNCTIGVPLMVKDDAPSGKDNLLFYRKPGDDKTAALAGILAVTIQNTKAVPPSPIPPGLTAQVDIMWKVLPRQAVADSYGDRVADGFFAVEATIGNNTGYDLQLAAVGFEPPEFECLDESGADSVREGHPPHATKVPTMVPCHYSDVFNGSSQKGFLWMFPDKVPAASEDRTAPPLPVDAYPVVRSTVEREQFVGTRAIVVNLVKSSGSVLVGVGSAFYGTGGLFNPAVAIFGTSFEKGLELVYPDLTTNHLVALDNRTLRTCLKTVT